MILHKNLGGWVFPMRKAGHTYYFLTVHEHVNRPAPGLNLNILPDNWSHYDTS